MKYYQLRTRLYWLFLLQMFLAISINAQYEYCQQTNPCSNKDLGNYTVSGQKWYKHELKYIFANGTDDIAGEDEKNAFYFAFDAWANEMPFIFTEVYTYDDVDIEIIYETREAIYSTGARVSYCSVLST